MITQIAVYIFLVAGSGFDSISTYLAVGRTEMAVERNSFPLLLHNLFGVSKAEILRFSIASLSLTILAFVSFSRPDINLDMFWLSSSSMYFGFTLRQFMYSKNVIEISKAESKDSE